LDIAKNEEAACILLSPNVVGQNLCCILSSLVMSNVLTLQTTHVIRGATKTKQKQQQRTVSVCWKTVAPSPADDEAQVLMTWFFYGLDAEANS